jgi:peptide/nickel transport system substrate-binding protein
MTKNRDPHAHLPQLWACWRVLFVALLVAGSARAEALAEAMRRGIAMHGQPALADGFKHLPYANPEAPKGGQFVQGVLGTFDSLNPLIVKGIAPLHSRLPDRKSHGARLRRAFHALRAHCRDS